MGETENTFQLTKSTALPQKFNIGFHHTAGVQRDIK